MYVCQTKNSMRQQHAERPEIARRALVEQAQLRRFPQVL